MQSAGRFRSIRRCDSELRGHAGQGLTVNYGSWFVATILILNRILTIEKYVQNPALL